VQVGRLQAYKNKLAGWHCRKECSLWGLGLARLINNRCGENLMAIEEISAIYVIGRARLMPSPNGSEWRVANNEWFFWRAVLPHCRK